MASDRSDVEGPTTVSPVPASRSQVSGLVQRQARALGDPTRYAIFRHVADAPSPVPVTALVARFGFNATAIRQHLTKLCDARLLVEESAKPSGPGRPPRRYRLASPAMGTWGSPGPYELLALLLLKVARRDHGPVEAGYDAGWRLASDYRPVPDPVDVVEAEMARRGFEPRRERHGSLVELVLQRCPFEAAAAADQDVVCGIHRGLAEGLLDALGADLKVSALIAYEPRRAGCRLQITQGIDR